LIGVDLSSKMIEKCQEQGIYTELFVEDIHATLERESEGQVDLIISADTFIYVGDLDRSFALCWRALKPGGLFTFSIENLDSHLHQQKVVSNGMDSYVQLAESLEESSENLGFKLLHSGRYAQSHKYIEELSSKHGFVILSRCTIEVVIRKEQGDDIPGLIFVLEKQEQLT